MDRKIAESLSVDNDRITSLRLGGIVGHRFRRHADVESTQGALSVM